MRPPVRPRRVALDERPVVPPPRRPRAPRPTSGTAGPRAPRATAPDGASAAEEGRVAAPRPVGHSRLWSPARPPVVSQGSAARFAERVELRRRLARRKALVVGVVTLVLAAVAWLLLLSPVLALDLAEVEVRGEGTVVDARAVADVVAAHDGTPLPRLDTVGLRRAVLDVPGVRAAEVARVWPQGLRVTVVSREPVAAVPQEAGGFALLDTDGVQVGRVDAAPEGLPVISVPLEDPGARAMTAVLAVLEQVPVELAAEVVAASAASQDTVRLTLADGVRVEWGSADETALKARVLQTLRASEAVEGVTVYDVSAPTLPITRTEG